MKNSRTRYGRWTGNIVQENDLGKQLYLDVLLGVHSRSNGFSSEEPLPRRLPVLLRHSWYGLNQAFRRRIAHLELTPDQFTVLRNLAEAPGLTQRELCARMASDPNTVAALTARMAGAGWIERTACSRDRRANRLRLLPAGRRKLNRARRIAMDLQAEVSADLGSDELETLLDGLTRLARSCQSALRRSAQTPATPPRQAP